MVRTVTEIGIKGALDRGAAGKDGGPELFQIVPSLAKGRRTVTQEGGALPGKDLVELATGHGANSRHGCLSGFVHACSADAAHKP
jgi:hypothetical protein